METATDYLKSGRGRAVMISRGDVIPENAVPMTDMDVLQIQEDRLKRHKPQSEVKALKYGAWIISGCTSLSAMYMHSIVRQGFCLGALSRGITFIPTVLSTAVFSTSFHDRYVRRNILLGRETCPTCTAVRGGALQIAFGMGYAYFMSVLACLPVARKYYTLPVPEKLGSGLGSVALGLVRRVSPSPTILLAFGVVNMMSGMYIAGRELQAFAFHLSKPPKGPEELPTDMQPQRMSS